MYSINTPRIYVVHDGSFSSEKIDEIQYGIEEEGLFSKQVEFYDNDIHQAAATFACDSAAGVCVAVNKNLALLAYEKCGPQCPVLTYTTEEASFDFFRNLGKNAARLMKGLPFVRP